MRTFVLFCASLFAMLSLISASPVLAQNVLWVSPNGSNANACSETAPCLTFQGAYDKGSVSQINCLGSGLYGSITITASLTIDCGDGNIGNIINSVASGITINTSAAATIVLRHLAVNGFATTTSADAIRALSLFSGTLIVEDCMLHGYHNGFGVNFIPTNGRGLLQVSKLPNLRQS